MLSKINFLMRVSLLLLLPVASGFSVLPHRSSIAPFKTLESPLFSSASEDECPTNFNVTYARNCSYAHLPHEDLTNLTEINDFVKSMEKLFEDRTFRIKQLAGDWKHQMEYRDYANGFNRRFNKKPNFVLYCENTEDVQCVLTNATKNNLRIRVRSGGHDHEAESTGDAVVVIDVSGLNHTTRVEGTNIFNVGPGNCFYKVSEDLAVHDRMLAHGTCGSVNVGGFTMGGGWGPWTRVHGMNCERVVGATIVLGDGSVVNATKDENADLLWAIKGGGGFSYGLVTNFQIDTFALPPELIRFTITWNPYESQVCENCTAFEDIPHRKNVTTLKVLKQWEDVITSNSTPRLIGTNLQVTACPREEGKSIDYENVYNNCIMFGYWNGTNETLYEFVEEKFGDMSNYIFKPNRNYGGSDIPENTSEDVADLEDAEVLLAPKQKYQNFNDWHRPNTAQVLRAAVLEAPEDFSEFLSDKENEAIREGKPLPADNDLPAPHKITNRLVDACGLGDEGYKAYINSLWSPFVLEGNRKLGLNQYTTLGAIVGDYYRNNPDPHAVESSFPFKDKLYTIQYQTWWNTKLYGIKEMDSDPVYTRTNRALTWMEVVRDYDIPNTSGAFISFKDGTIPTPTYFGKNYERLKEIKQNYSKDPLNHFRSPKTII